VGRTGDVDPTGRELDEEEHVERPEPDRLDGEEVTGDDSFGLGTQELRPVRAIPPGAGPMPFRRRI
jgi:hypothetical protein